MHTASAAQHGLKSFRESQWQRCEKEHHELHHELQTIGFNFLVQSSKCNRRIFFFSGPFIHFYFLFKILSGLVFVLPCASYWSVFEETNIRKNWGNENILSCLRQGLTNYKWPMSQIWPTSCFLNIPWAKNKFYLFKSFCGRGEYVTEIICGLQSQKYLLCSILWNKFANPKGKVSFLSNLF